MKPQLLATIWRARAGSKLNVKTLASTKSTHCMQFLRLAFLLVKVLLIQSNTYISMPLKVDIVHQKKKVDNND